MPFQCLESCLPAHTGIDTMSTTSTDHTSNTTLLFQLCPTYIVKITKSGAKCARTKEGRCHTASKHPNTAIINMRSHNASPFIHFLSCHVGPSASTSEARSKESLFEIEPPFRSLSMRFFSSFALRPATSFSSTVSELPQVCVSRALTS